MNIINLCEFVYRLHDSKKNPLHRAQSGLTLIKRTADISSTIQSAHSDTSFFQYVCVNN